MTPPASSDVRRHATLPQPWIQREHWEFETHRWYDLTDEEYEAEFAARKARQGAATNQQR